jgi:hypothetical protein
LRGDCFLDAVEARRWAIGAWQTATANFLEGKRQETNSETAGNCAIDGLCQSSAGSTFLIGIAEAAGSVRVVTKKYGVAASDRVKARTVSGCFAVRFLSFPLKQFAVAVSAH